MRIGTKGITLFEIPRTFRILLSLTEATPTLYLFSFNIDRVWTLPSLRKQHPVILSNCYMAKEIPYFQFVPGEYLTGSIQFCTLAAQGLYINICALYWSRVGELKESQIRRKYDSDLIDELIHEGLIKSSSDDDHISITFLDEQLEELSNGAKNQRKKALKGWETRRKKSKRNDDHAIITSSSNDKPVINDDIESDIDNDNDIPPKSPKGEGEKMDEWKLFCDLYPIDPNYSKCQIQWCKVAPELWPKIIQDVKKRFPPGTNTQFVPNPDKYLRDMGWEMPIRQTSNDQPVDDGKPKNLPNNHPVMIAWKLNKDKYKQ